MKWIDNMTKQETEWEWAGCSKMAYYCLILVSIVSFIAAYRVPSAPLETVLIAIGFLASIASLYQIPYVKFILRQRGIVKK